MGNNTMKNSASNSSNLQALQAHAQQLLPLLTQALFTRHYTHIAHHRLSQKNNGCETDHQGLSSAQHKQFGHVMIKWQLRAFNDDTSQSSTKCAGLTYETDVLNAINKLSNHQNTAIAPTVLADKKLIVQIAKQPQQLTILVMPYYANGSLKRQINSQNYLSLTYSKKYQFIKKSACLIHRLHQIGWLHNDIKPSNILLDDMLPNQAKNSSLMPNLLLTDFALAENTEAAKTLNYPAGTPAYIAPERWHGKHATMQSDIYAFGIMMFEILAGERPFKSDKQSNEPLKEWAVQHCQQPVPKLPLEYSRYQHIIDKALAKRLERRYRSMEEACKDLRLLENR